MTTESTQDTRTGFSPLLGALAAGAAAVLVLVVAAALVDGRAAVVEGRADAADEASSDPQHEPEEHLPGP